MMPRTLNSNDDDNNANTTKTIKFLYSYGGKILPRRSDGILRYVGGHTRVLAVHRSITYAELMVRFGELSGSSMSLKCKLPSEDLDVLVSITCDEDLVNIIDEYDRFSSSTKKDLKIRAVLVPLKSLKKISPVSSVDFSSAVSSPPYATAGLCSAPPPRAATAPGRYGGRSPSPSPAFGYPVGARKDGGKVRYYPCCQQENPRHLYFVPRRTQWQ